MVVGTYAGISIIGSQPITRVREQLHQHRVTKQKSAFVALMGSGVNLLIALACSLLLWLFKPQGWGLKLLLCGALLFYDILNYSIFPTYFGLPHLMFAGGMSPEPIIALQQLGLGKHMAVMLVCAVCLLQLIYLFRYLHRMRRLNSRPSFV